MKLTFSCYTILIIVISVDCGLVKKIFGNVKEDVHTVVDGTVSVIGKGTHKITEGLGLFLHRNEGNKFPGPQTDASAPSNQISNEKIDVNNNNEAAHNVNEENFGINENAHGYDQSYNHVQSTNVAEHTFNSNNNVNIPENNQHAAPTTESNYNENIKQDENINSNNIIHDHTIVPATITSTTETSWLNGAELENILPTITQNETHFTGNTNELGAGDNLTNNAFKESIKQTVKSDIKPIENQINKDNLVSDQLFFNDNKPKPNISNYVCAEGLVRTANGECLKQIEIDVRKKVEPIFTNVFQADGCVSGYARALDGTCQKIIG